VKISALLIKGYNDGTAPKDLKLFTNQQTLNFDDVGNASFSQQICLPQDVAENVYLFIYVCLCLSVFVSLVMFVYFFEYIYKSTKSKFDDVENTSFSQQICLPQDVVENGCLLLVYACLFVICSFFCLLFMLDYCLITRTQKINAKNEKNEIGHSNSTECFKIFKYRFINYFYRNQSRSKRKNKN
jgi:hypothetical protein